MRRQPPLVDPASDAPDAPRSLKHAGGWHALSLRRARQSASDLLGRPRSQPTLVSPSLILGATCSSGARGESPLSVRTPFEDSGRATQKDSGRAIPKWPCNRRAGFTLIEMLVVLFFVLNLATI